METEKRKFKPRVNPKDNTITIHPIKDSWTKEEIIKIFKPLLTKGYISFLESEFDKWIEENL